MIFVSSGLLWDHNSTEMLYFIKKNVDLKVAFVVYDIIPILMPEYCVDGIQKRFSKYILDTAWSGDVLYCISDSTRTDLRRYLEEIEAPVPKLERVHLGSDAFPKQVFERPDRFAFLEEGKFVLCVGTLEPRKNHRLLLDVWRHIYRENEEILLPLVIVGSKGWRFADFLTNVEQAVGLTPDYIRLFDGVSDRDLAWLYRNCRFTVYPSLYEGWGLPVAESLAYGKLCLCSDTSSMPEVGQDLAELLDPYNTTQWKRRVAYYLRNDARLRRQEEVIVASYRTTSWNESFSVMFAGAGAMKTAGKPRRADVVRNFRQREHGRGKAKELSGK